MDLGDDLMEGETLETPKASDQSQTCVVSVLRAHGPIDDALANIVGLRYVKLRQDSDTFSYSGVTETPVHRVYRTVSSVVSRPARGDRTALDYLLERQDMTLRELEYEACAHIDRAHPDWENCWIYDAGLTDLVQMLMIGDTPLSRCFVELAELYECADCTYAIGEMAERVWRMVRGDLFLTGHESGGTRVSNWLRDAPTPYSNRVPSGARAKTDECRALFQARFERHGIDNPWSDDE